VALAAEQGLKVLQGIWLDRNRAENRREIEAALRLVRRYPGTIEALIVGNETLLRGELPPAQIKAYLEEVKQRSGVPVTYADVWEFWLKARELATATDFITIHVLPYWEDKPVSIAHAIDHVRQVRTQLQAAFPIKEILIGEVGWPSRGRMREGARPSPANQALFISGVVAIAKENGWKVNLIEAFDQPWKRALEGTVGGFWGLYDGGTREPKFELGEPVSNHPNWELKAALGSGIALFVFLCFWLGLRQRTGQRTWHAEAACAAIAFGSGLLIGIAAVNVPIEGEMAVDRLRAAGMLILALAAPMVAGYAVGRGNHLSGFARALDPSSWQRTDLVEIVLSALLAATVFAAIHAALGLVFEPRDKDFPIAGLLGPVVAFAVLAFASADSPSRPGAAEIAASMILICSALFVIANEGIANWQAVVFAALLAILALSLLRAKGAPG
jgi:glucan 1,3-beta-glucosidase